MKRISLALVHGLIALSSVVASGDEVNWLTSPTPSSPIESSAASSANSTKVDEKKGMALDQVGGIIQQAADTCKASSLKNYKEVQQSCADKAETAEFICRENTNPDIVKAMPLIQAAVAGLSGANDACSKFAEAMDLANKALLAYQGGCAAAKGLCQMKCSDAKKALTAGEAEVKAEVVKENSPSGQCTVFEETFKNAAEKERGPKPKSVAKHLSTCDSYATQLASAMAGAIGVLNSMQKAKDCDKKTKVATPTPMGLSTSVDCTIEANRLNNQTCICQAAPRTPGCPGGLDNNLNANRADMMGTTDLGGYTPGKVDGMDTGVDGNVGDLPGGGSSGDGRSSGPGAPVGGRGAGIDGGGGFGGPGAPTAGKSASGLNTNILGGEAGGGGGRGSFGGSGRGGDNSDLRNYLPGGQKDPLAGNQVAGQGSNKDVTTPGGKSNWEKVRDRYRENNSSLLGN